MVNKPQKTLIDSFWAILRQLYKRIYGKIRAKLENKHDYIEEIFSNTCHDFEKSNSKPIIHIFFANEMEKTKTISSMYLWFIFQCNPSPYFNDFSKHI